MAKKRDSLRLSVHELVDFLLREGDIDNRVYNQETMQLGSKLHAAFQSKQGNDYLSEVYLKDTFVRGEYEITLEGRADGIIVGGQMPIIDEIKTSVMALEEFYSSQKEWHFGQAKCYAYLYLKEKGLNECGISLTYISQIDPKEKISRNERYSYKELEEYVFSLIDSYIALNKQEFDHLAKRNKSASRLSFPYKEFRRGQREMAKYVYGASKKGGIFFCEAPTGIGKTISSLYPVLKSLEKSGNSKIFYLTAKTSGRNSAYDAMSACYKSGLVARDSLLTAKEKICFNPDKNCNPDECLYARGYYGKIRQVISEEIGKTNRYDFKTVREMAKRHSMCPFELQLDLSLLSDVIIGDYNYFFDPLVKLKRYFDPSVDSSRFFLIIDEAHNLPSRVREMFSQSLSLKNALHLKKKMVKVKAKKLKSSLNKLIKAFEELSSSFDGDFKELAALPSSFGKALTKFVEAGRKDEESLEALPSAYKDFARSCYRLDFLYSNYFVNAVITCAKSQDEVEVRLQSLDPSSFMKEDLGKVKGAAIFSGTLSPISYYMDSIVSSSSHPYLLLPSPFPKENFNLMIAPTISIRYKDRDRSYGEVAALLKSFVSSKKGNYFLFFPSYEYLSRIKPHLDFMDATLFWQEKDMGDREKEDLLNAFISSDDKSNVALLIIGGSFSEGIDLYADRLIGVAVVGMGLPQLSNELDILKRYYEKKNGNGFAYAYMNPGVNKVMQAVGRLIRSETDVGSALLIDDRYLKGEYRSLFERSWPGYEVVTNEEDIKNLSASFYLRKRK